MDKYKIRVCLYKGEFVRYFSQLDLVKILERALRRTELPLYLTRGFNPHVKMSFGDALKLGKEGKVEVIFYFSQKVPPSVVKDKLLPQLPQGLDVIDCIIYDSYRNQ